MRRHVKEVTVKTSPGKLWQAITDIHRWPEWDPGLEHTEHDGRLDPGRAFALKPRGGPRVKMTIEAAREPTLFSDIAHLPLAKMRTGHEFLAEGDATRIRLTIEVTGPLGFLWNQLVARPLVAGFEAQARALAAFADGAR